MRDKKLLEARVAELRSSAGRLEKQVGDRDGELLAARKATREAREAFVETNGRNGKEKGAVEYLKSVVRTALPPRGGAPDAGHINERLTSCHFTCAQPSGTRANESPMYPGRA